MSCGDFKKQIAVLLVMIVSAMFASGVAFALNPKKAISQYVHDMWTTEDGLPQNSILSISQTRDGYLWLGTWGGLARFDGVRFTVFNRGNTPALKNNYIYALYEDREGSLYLSDATNAAIVDRQGVGTILNDDSTPALSIGDKSLKEGDAGITAFNFTVKLSTPSSVDVMVNFATADDTATAGSNYISTSGTLTIPAGSSTATITVSVNGDTTFESRETFFVNLSDPVNATIAGGQGVGTIRNDDNRH